MHELSIALSVVDLAQEEAERQGVRVLAVHLKLGPLSGVVAEALASAYEMASTGTPLEGSRLIVEEVPVVVYCPQCKERRTLPSMYLFECPECHTPTPDVVMGRELQVTALEVES